MKNKIIALSLAAVLCAGCIAVYAAAPANDNVSEAPRTERRTFAEKGDVHRPPHASGRDMKMKAPELTEEQIAEMTEKLTAELKEKLDAGEITQEEYDSLLAKLENGEPVRLHKAPDGHGRPPFEKPELTEEQMAEMTEKLTAELKEKLEAGEITQEEYDSLLAKLENGEPVRLHKAPDGHGRPAFEKPELTEEKIAEMQEKALEKLNERLEKGEVTQEEYDTLLTAIENGDFAPGFKGKRNAPPMKPDFGKGKELPEAAQE